MATRMGRFSYWNSSRMNLQETLESVRRVEVRTNRLVNDMMVGAYLSRFKGRGMDFEELRDYMPGDDVRDIDWNVTFRMGRPFVKRYREERELGVILAVDISASSAFGSTRRSKRESAVEIAATLASSAARSSDKVGLVLFTDQIELYLPPRKGRRHILRTIKEMLFFQPKHAGTNIPAALGFLNHVITNTRHDLICVHLHDPRESELPSAGLVAIEDAETGELLELDSMRPAVRETYAATNRERLADLDRTLRQTGVDTLRFSTGEPFAQTLQTFFETRRGRRRG